LTVDWQADRGSGDPGTQGLGIARSSKSLQ